MPITRPSGNSRAAAMRRLSRHRPDLAERVEKGELSCQRAMIEAGFKRIFATVNLHDPRSAARTIKAKTSGTFRDELVAALMADEGGYRPGTTAWNPQPGETVVDAESGEVVGRVAEEADE